MTFSDGVVFGLACVGAVLGLAYLGVRWSAGRDVAAIRAELTATGAPEIPPVAGCPNPCSAVDRCIFPLACEAPATTRPATS